MTRRILPHGASALLAATVLAMGEIAINEADARPFIGDGRTQGGKGVAFVAELDAIDQDVQTRALQADLLSTTSRLALVEGTITSGRKGYATYADAVADLANIALSTLVEVPTSDAGTHTDPVAGGTVNNTGVFRKEAGGLLRLYDVDAVAAANYAAAAQAAAASIVANRATLLEVTPQTTTRTAGTRVLLDGTTETPGSSYTLQTLAFGVDVEQVVITSSPIGTGYPLGAWFDGAGNFLSATSQRGGASYASLALPVPAGARSIKINSNSAQTFSVSTVAMSVNLANRLHALEGLGVQAIANSITTWQDQALSPVLDMHCDPDGGFTAGVGYQYAKVALTGTEKSVRVTGTVTGTSRNLVEYYTDAACTPANHISGQFLGSGAPGAPYVNQVVTPPSNARGMAVNSMKASALSVQFYAIDPAIGDKIKQIKNLASTFSGLAGASFGDSTVNNYNWQPQVQAVLGLSRYDNNGIGGTRISYRHDIDDQTSCGVDDARINAIANDIDWLSILFGINDHGQNVPLGALTDKGVRTADSFDPYTFYGACELMALKLKTKFPNTRMLWMGQTYVDRFAQKPSGWSDSLTNTLELTQWDYEEAVRQVCRKWGIPFVSMIEECGWDSTNITSFVTNEPSVPGAYVHPNQAGGNRMAEVVIARARSLQRLAA